MVAESTGQVDRVHRPYAICGRSAIDAVLADNVEARTQDNLYKSDAAGDCPNQAEVE